MPAKAGIQHLFLWVPAFAGTSEWGDTYTRVWPARMLV